MTLQLPSVQHDRVTSKMRALLLGYVPEAVAAFNTATGRTGSRQVLAPSDVRVCTADFEVPIDVLPIVTIVEVGTVAVPENIAQAQDFIGSYTVGATYTYDGADPTNGVARACALAAVALEVLAARLPDFCTDTDGFIIRADTGAITATAPAQVDDSLWLVTAGGVLEVYYRAARPYLPTYTGDTLVTGYVNSTLETGDASAVCTGSGVAAVTVAQGSQETISLTSGQIAATTALTVTFPTGALADGSAVVWLRQGPGFARADSTATSNVASVSTGTLALADGDVVLIIGIGATGAPYVYRIAIEVT